MRSRIAVALVVAAPLCASAQVPDPGAIGPYAIGHTSFRVVDASRNATSEFGGRPVAVEVWYPADVSDVTSETPEAVYSFDPIYRRFRLPGANCRTNPIYVDATSLASEWSSTPVYEGIAPSAAAPFPLVLLSPGWKNRAITYSRFAELVASHGFVVAVTQHYLDGVGDGCTTGAPAEPSDPFPVAMLNRPIDLMFMLDALTQRNADGANLLFNSIRSDLVVAAGHSLGGYAALALAGGDDVVCDLTTFDANQQPTSCTPVSIVVNGQPAGTTLPDTRIKAIVTLDASNPLLQFSELQRIAVPALTIGESFEAPAAAWNAFFPARQHAAISSRSSYRLDVLGALHQSFTRSCTGAVVQFDHGYVSTTNMLNQPQCTTALPQAEVARLSAKYTVAFLKRTLAGDTAYQRMLTPGAVLRSETNIEFFVTEPGSSDDPNVFQFFSHQPGGAQKGQVVHAECKDPAPKYPCLIDP